MATTDVVYNVAEHEEAKRAARPNAQILKNLRGSYPSGDQSMIHHGPAQREHHAAVEVIEAAKRLQRLAFTAKVSGDGEA